MAPREQRRPAHALATGLALVLGAAFVLGASGCKKENRLPGGGAAPTAPVTHFVPPGPKCVPRKLPSGAVVASTRDDGLRTFAVYPDGHIVASRRAGNEDIPEYPASIGAARVAKLEAELLETGAFAQPQGCWIASGDFGESSGPSATIRHGEGSWAYASGGGDVPPSIAKADALVKQFIVEVANVVDRQDAAAPPRNRTHE